MYLEKLETITGKKSIIKDMIIDFLAKKDNLPIDIKSCKISREDKDSGYYIFDIKHLKGDDIVKITHAFNDTDYMNSDNRSELPLYFDINWINLVYAYLNKYAPELAAEYIVYAQNLVKKAITRHKYDMLECIKNEHQCDVSAAKMKYHNAISKADMKKSKAEDILTQEIESYNMQLSQLAKPEQQKAKN